MPDTANQTTPQVLPRLKTGIDGLDVLLGGGFIDGGLYLIEGVPGAGKTILASQIGFHFAKAGKKVLLVTLIAESYGKLLRHLHGFRFFDESLIGDQITLLSGFQVMLDEGLGGLTRFIAEALSEHRCSLLLLDGFAAARDFSESTS
jgi:circadian clock protein KaiC